MHGPKVDQGLTFDVWSPANRYIKMSMDSKCCQSRGTPRKQESVCNLRVSRTCFLCLSEFPCYFLCQRSQFPLRLTCKLVYLPDVEREKWLALFCETSMHQTGHCINSTATCMCEDFKNKAKHSTWLPWSKSKHLLRQIDSLLWQTKRTASAPG